MADDRYDSDYWAMAEFQWQNLRESLFGLPAVPGGRPFRPISNAASENVEDRRVVGEPSDLQFDANWEQAQNRALNDIFRNALRRTEPYPYGDPESFQRQDPLR